MKYNLFFTLALILLSVTSTAQTKQEREFRIDEEAFPQKSTALIKPYLNNAKRIRYYKEYDGKKTSFEIKFKKDRLRYSVEFDDSGVLEDVEFIIKKVDIPSTSFTSIQNYLNKHHESVKIKKIQQQYLIKDEKTEQLLKEAFQNLLLTSVRYEIVISSKSEKGYEYYEVTFDNDGGHISSRKFSDSNYDHVLY